jgi:Cu/Ag efflux protein CusF
MTMRTSNITLFWLVAGLTLTGAPLLLTGTAQTPAAPALQSTVGTVTKIDTGARTISLKTDQNQEVSIRLQPNASFRRVAPGETNLSNASTIEMTAVGVGDRVLARGNNEGQIVSANLIVVMSQGDVASKQAAEKADWDKRGVSGLVTAVTSDSVTINVRGAGGITPVVIALDQRTIVRRYAPDSVNFVDAKMAKLEDIRTGDQVRARGDRNENGSRIAAVEIVSGRFKTIAGLILSIDMQNSEVRIRDLDTKMPVVVKLSKDSKIQKAQPQVAQAIGARLHPEAGGTSGGRGGGGRGAGGGDIQQMLEGSPPISLADLKNGDAVMISSTIGSTTDRITAISLIAGVEPILTKPGTKEMSIGAWNLDVGGGGGQ